MKIILMISTIIMLGLVAVITFSQSRADKSVLDRNKIVFKDTVKQFVFDSLVNDFGIYDSLPKKMIKYFKYIGHDSLRIVKVWTSDPHYICDYPREFLIPGKIYHYEICFATLSRPGYFIKIMGFNISDGEVISFPI